ncbi:MAG: hypothetical protein IK048_02280 [Clostridia bacterium]|nr:hypothetical protein [Clostridia bacterium]
MKKSFKTAFLYIGTAIGAGFSSGREIALFFGDASPINVALSSIVMSAFACLFLTAGKLRLIPKGKIVKLGILFSASISLVAMLAGGEYIMRTMTTVPLLALVMALLGAVVVSQGIEKIRIVNLLLVPLIVIAIAVIFFQIPKDGGSQNFSILKPIMYGGLDILLGGVIVGNEGEEMSFKEILLSSALIAVFLFAMLFMLQTIVLADENDSLMPVFAISERLHLQAICGILIAAAIFTTLVSSLKIASDVAVEFLSKTRRLSALAYPQNKSVVVTFCLVVFYPLSFFGFGKIVGTMYPINSVLGVLLSLAVLARLIVFAVKKLKNKNALSKKKA